MSEASEGSTTVPNQLAILVPSLDPSKDDLQVYTQKVELLLEAWPASKYTELATRLILNCVGSAFKKLQLHQSEITKNEKKSIQRIIELLGGHWGQIPLERRYEFAERALYKCVQKSDETADSYLARADITWTELNNTKFQVSDLQAYVTLRGSMLSSEDKKRVLIDADVADKGELTVSRVSSAIRMLGAGFFQEMTSGRKVSKLKTYDQSALTAEDMEETETDQPAFATDGFDDEDQVVDALVQEGDEDATLVADFEAAASEVLQTDDELAAAFTAYQDARRRLNDKVRSRGFWPPSQKGKQKGSSKGVKGKFQKGHYSSRKSLQQRILESRCRLCGRVGHWKAECPSRNDQASSASRVSPAPTTFVQVSQAGSTDQVDGLPLEFLNLPMHEDTKMDATQTEFQFSFVTSTLNNMTTTSNAKDKLHKTLQAWNQQTSNQSIFTSNDTATVRNEKISNVLRARLADRAKMSVPMPVPSPLRDAESEVCFASHGCLGIVDLGATKTVIGSNLVKELLEGLHPSLRSQVFRCPCEITFRFGNHGVLHSKVALVVPIHRLQLKVAIVPGSTPFLLSSTLLRALSATIDTEKHLLFSRKLNQEFPLQLTSKGLFLLDLNLLAQQQPGSRNIFPAAETHPAIDAPGHENLKSKSFPAAPIKANQEVVHNSHRESNLQSEQCFVESPQNAQGFVKSQPDCNHLPEDTQQIDRQSTNRSKPLPQGFPITRDCHVQPCPEVAEHPEASGGESPGPLTSLPGPAARSEDPIWKDTPRKNVPSDVAERAGMDHLVRAEVFPISQGRASRFPEIRRTGNRASRAQWRTSAGDQPEGFREGAQPLHHTANCPSEQCDQGSGQACSSADSRADTMGLRRRGCGVVRSPPGAIGGSQIPADREPGESHDECRSDVGQHLAAPRDLDRQALDRTVNHSECPSLLTVDSAGDVRADWNLHTDTQTTPETNREAIHFHQLVQQFSQEFQKIHKNTATCHARLNVLEIFCHAQSQLTHQAQRLGFKADRFGLQQGDLHTADGRAELFKVICRQQPQNLWFSPSCGPWSGFSCLNGSRSLQAWDDLQALRMQHLEQVALGIVLLRYQRQQNRHSHWEQPKGSLMFKLPYLQEAMHYLLSVDIDLCTAGELKDPENGKLIKKALTIMTTSQHMVQSLQGLRCNQQHEHQVIEGQVKVNGQNMNRSTFTEHYPRKFARRLAYIMGKAQIPKEPVYRNDVWSILAAEEHPEAPVPKKPKRERYTSLKISRVREVSTLPWGKRQKCVGTTTPIDAKGEWETIFAKLQKELPRVGKKELPVELCQRIQMLMPNMKIHTVMACRGSSRTLAPPDNMVKGLAPYRRSIFMERGSGEIRAEEEWEMWENLAKRNLIRPSHATRINVTVFANKLPVVMPPAVPSSETSHSAPERQVHVDANANSSAPARPEQSEEVVSEPVPEAKILPECPDLTSSQRADACSEAHGSRFKALPRDEQIALIRAHKNLGHPSPERLSTVLRSQGYRAEVARAALDLRCSVCQEHGNPKIARPSSLRDEGDFNDRICIDGLSWNSKSGKQFHVYHVVDWSTSFHVARIAPDRSSQSAIQILIDMWLSWAGCPCEMIVDAATEFNSDEFTVFAQSHNIRVTTISTEAQFQNGKAERHGSILKTMLDKYDAEHPIEHYQDLSQALFWCTQAKNAHGLKRGYAPEVLVLGKHTRIPGAVCSDELLPAHLLAESETAHGISFRRQLARRESARHAFVHADNDAALRRAILRRARPGDQKYSPGEWVMCWRPGKGTLPGMWAGPMKVVVHENSQTIWTTQSSKLYRCAPEHIRPVSANEAQGIPLNTQEPSVSTIAQQISNFQSQGITRAIESMPLPNIPQENPPLEATGPEQGSEGQPDDEPEIPSHQSTKSVSSNPPTESPNIPNDNNPNTDLYAMNNPGIQTPVPEAGDDELVCDSLLCTDVDADTCLLTEGLDLAWRCEVVVTEKDILSWRDESSAEEMAFVASAAKRQRAEVKLSTLTSAEKAMFQQAKETEIQNWIKTGTISRILRDKIPYNQILRCRWILTWKPVDAGDGPQKSQQATTKAKARLVILGYLDPQLEELPRDSPTLGHNAKMLLLQLIASMGWQLSSFDIKAAFLQGKTQADRTLAIEPVPELIQALQLSTNEVLKLEKGAYGLVDAPYLWYQAISEELIKLGFSQSPFDPCQFLLRHHQTGNLEGILGLHVDDGICGGSQYFLEKINQLERKYPFGSKKLKQFTFTGIEMDQRPDGTITMKQTKYVNAIEPIKISQQRRSQGEEPITEEEKQSLRAIIGSLQYAAVEWKRPSHALGQLPETISTATYRSQNLPESLAATDCKSLYDLITRTAAPNCSEYRTMLNARAIKDYLQEGVLLRWVHSGAQLADSLTKIMENSFLRETLKIGYYKLHDELEVLKNRASSRNRLKWLRSSSAEESAPHACNDECFVSYNNDFLGV
eukprot:s4573_g4.t1